MRLIDADAFKEWLMKNSINEREKEESRQIGIWIDAFPSAEPEIEENLYLCKCYITDKDGLQHEVIHTGDIRRVTGWEI